MANCPIWLFLYSFFIFARRYAYLKIKYDKNLCKEKKDNSLIVIVSSRTTKLQLKQGIHRSTFIAEILFAKLLKFIRKVRVVSGASSENFGNYSKSSASF